jgi:hypothetical protein
MPVVVPRSDPRALKACDLGRHVRRRLSHVELVRQRNDRFRIDSERLGLNAMRQHQQCDRNDSQHSTHVPLEASALTGNGAI